MPPHHQQPGFKAIIQCHKETRDCGRRLHVPYLVLPQRMGPYGTKTHWHTSQLSRGLPRSQTRCKRLSHDASHIALCAPVRHTLALAATHHLPMCCARLLLLPSRDPIDRMLEYFRGSFRPDSWDKDFSLASACRAARRQGGRDGDGGCRAAGLPAPRPPHLILLPPSLLLPCSPEWARRGTAHPQP
jgi:hypothetical protein